LATTLGETGGDALSMTMNLGYAVSTAIFGALFVGRSPLKSRREISIRSCIDLIVATTTVGTTMAISPTARWESAMSGIAGLARAVDAHAWRVASCAGLGRRRPYYLVEAEAFYWVTIVFPTRSAPPWRFLRDDSGLGFLGAAAVFAGCLALIAAAYFSRSCRARCSFWAAFILTRPLGATLGDLLTNPTTRAA